MAGHKSPYFSSERGSGHRTGKGPSPDIPSSSWGLAPGGSYPSRGIPALFSPRAPPHSGLAWTPRGRGDTAYDPRAGGPGQPAGPEEGADYTAQCPQAAPSRAHHGQAGSGPVRTGPPYPPPRRVLKDALRIGAGGAPKQPALQICADPGSWLPANPPQVVTWGLPLFISLQLFLLLGQQPPLPGLFHSGVPEQPVGIVCDTIGLGPHEVLIFLQPFNLLQTIPHQGGGWGFNFKCWLQGKEVWGEGSKPDTRRGKSWERNRSTLCVRND